MPPWKAPFLLLEEDAPVQLAEGRVEVREAQVLLRRYLAQEHASGLVLDVKEWPVRIFRRSS